MSAILAKAALLTLLTQCQNDVSPSILKRLVDVETHSNQYAIAIVGGGAIYPKSLKEAVVAADKLEADNKNFSVGLMQVNKFNFDKYGLNTTTAFDACKNIAAGSLIYTRCYHRAKQNHPNRSQSELLNDAASCYYSGNFLRGYKKEGKNNTSYVDKFSHAKKIPRHLIAEVYADGDQHEKKENKKSASWDVFNDF